MEKKNLKGTSTTKTEVKGCVFIPKAIVYVKLFIGLPLKKQADK